MFEVCRHSHKRQTAVKKRLLGHEHPAAAAAAAAHRETQRQPSSASLAGLPFSSL